MGDHNEHIHKRLRTLESSSEAKQDPALPKQNVEEADAFEHIKQGSECYDAQTYGIVVFLGLRVVIAESNPEALLFRVVFPITFFKFMVNNPCFGFRCSTICLQKMLLFGNQVQTNDNIFGNTKLTHKN